MIGQVWSTRGRRLAALISGLLFLVFSYVRMSGLQHQVAGSIVPKQQPFQLAFTADHARELLSQVGNDASLIRAQLGWDLLFILGYALVGVALAGMAIQRQRDAKRTAYLFLTGAFHDLIENAAIAAVLAGVTPLQPLAFIASAGKLATLLFGTARLIWYGVLSRRGEERTGDAPAPAPATPSRRTGLKAMFDLPDSCVSFEKLVELEEAQLAEATNKRQDQADRTPLRDAPSESQTAATESGTVSTGPGGEPWLVRATQDRLGLALSGGGIRSATYNLGLLQGLAALGVLKRVDYLSTVSGGGYIGGFWMRWLVHRASEERGPGASHFPVSSTTRIGERIEIRHLREFSRFLLPRGGIHRTEFWSIVMTVLGGLLPSLVFAIALVALGWILWFTAATFLLDRSPRSVMAIAFAIAVILGLLEWRWLRKNKLQLSGAAADDPRAFEIIGYLFASEIVVSVVAIVWAALAIDAEVIGPHLSPTAAQRIAVAITDWASPVRWLAPALPLSIAALLLLALRPAIGRSVREFRQGVSLIAGMERSLSRTLELAAFAAALGFLWWLGSRLHGWAWPTAAGTAGLAATFAWLRKWLFEPVQDTRAGRALASAGHYLRRATPRVLATLALLLFLILVAALVVASWNLTSGSGAGVTFLQLTLGLGLVLLSLLVCFDPARVGLHEFYRSRISRCYLGASNTSVSAQRASRGNANRSLNEHPDDDMTLDELGRAQVRPLHLICTAANDLSGDHLANLYRGARSAVLSANGISIGDSTAPLGHLRFSAALTASAAAFNSQMGSVSMSLGPAVAFLMSTLNLRLGLWVPHPKNRRRGGYFFPGRFFLLELLGFSRADRNNLHLSDGGHFENMGLYELIRRHCRWIIVSDCGADGKSVFDDLGTVSRRVREDFGVELDLSTRPLLLDPDGQVKRHAIVGTIHYDGPTGADKGTLLLFKPTLTGGESADVLNYKAKSATFPHETTGDQFFDEAQWESYRRLGEHAVWSTLGFAESIGDDWPNFTDRLFMGVRDKLHPAADGNPATFVEMSNRCSELEQDLSERGPMHLRRELFPEASIVATDDTATPAPSQDDEISALSYLMRAIQIMEDVWLVCDLDRYWSQPLNEGWMNYFQRWASAPTFRRWWPILRPLYSNGFREFAKERFAVGMADPQVRPLDTDSTVAQLALVPIPTDRTAFEAGHAWRQYRQRTEPPADYAKLVVLAYQMRLASGAGSGSAYSLDVGFVLVDEQKLPDGSVAVINVGHFYVPPALSGAGITGRQLDAVLAYYTRQKFSSVRVNFDGRPPRGPAAREERVRLLEFFKSRGLQAVRGGNASTLQNVSLAKVLTPS